MFAVLYNSTSYTYLCNIVSCCCNQCTVNCFSTSLFLFSELLFKFCFWLCIISAHIYWATSTCMLFQFQLNCFENLLVLACIAFVSIQHNRIRITKLNLRCQTYSPGGTLSKFWMGMCPWVLMILS